MLPVITRHANIGMNTGKTPRAFIATEYLAQLVDMLASDGISAAQITAGTGLLPRTLASAQDLITPQQYHRVIDNALQLSGNPLLGLEYGTRLTIASHGFLGLAIMASDTLGQALSLAIRFARTRTLLADIRFEQDEQKACIQIHRLAAVKASFPFVAQHILATFLSMARYLTSQHPDLQACIHLEGEAQADEREYTRILQAPVVFGQPHYQLCLPLQALNLPVSGANTSARRLAETQCEKLLARLDKGQDIAIRIRQEFTRQQAFPGLPEMAALLNTSPRTLNRQLARLNTTFQTITDDVRRELAMKLLQDTRLTVDDIATRLGYTDPSNFSRAFRRWLGESPRAYREKHLP